MGYNKMDGNTSNRVILQIQDGFLTRKIAEGQFEQYKSVFGQLLRINVRPYDKKDANGAVIETRHYVDFDFRDGNDFFSISGGLHSQAMERIIQKLAVIPDLANGVVTVYAWPAEKMGKNGKPYNNIAVRFQGPNDASPQKVDGFAQVPPVTEETYKGVAVRVDKEHNEAVMRLIEDINARLKARPQVSPDGDPVPESNDPVPAYNQQPGYGAAPAPAQYGGQPAPAPMPGYNQQPGYGAAPAPAPGQPYGGQPAYPAGVQVGSPAPAPGQQPGGGYNGQGYQGGGYNGGYQGGGYQGGGYNGQR